jgi:hypothetical protein
MARLVLSHRLAGKKTKDARLESHQVFLNARAKFRAGAKIAGGRSIRPIRPVSSCLMAMPATWDQNGRGLPADVVLESETFRKTARFRPRMHAVSRRVSARGARVITVTTNRRERCYATVCGGSGGRNTYLIAVRHQMFKPVPRNWQPRLTEIPGVTLLRSTPQYAQFSSEPGALQRVLALFGTDFIIEEVRQRSPL